MQRAKPNCARQGDHSVTYVPITPEDRPRISDSRDWTIALAGLSITQSGIPTARWVARIPGLCQISSTAEAVRVDQYALKH